MKNSSTILMLLAVGIFITIDVYSEFKDQNTFCIEVDPKYATTIFIDMEDALKVETWNEDYILFQINVESCSQAPKILNYLESNKENIIKQEFTVNDFLLLTVENLSKILDTDGSNLDEKLSYKVTVPDHLDLKLKCNNDLMIYYDIPENPETGIEKYTQKIN
jgi:hypothetical protein